MRIAGIDEAGRGPLAGPVVAAAVILPMNFSHPEITDSKKLSPKKREILFELIQDIAEDWAICEVGPRYIDRFNIRESTKRAMSEAARRLNASLLRIDGNMKIDSPLPQQTIIGGDAKHIEISAASILAKVWRDRIMRTLEEQFPGYGLGSHAGYPTKSHKDAVFRIGPSPVHRLTFRGVREHAEGMDIYAQECCKEYLERDVYVVCRNEPTVVRSSAVFKLSLSPTQ